MVFFGFLMRTGRISNNEHPKRIRVILTKGSPFRHLTKEREKEKHPAHESIHKILLNGAGNFMGTAFKKS
jgi:hypothetical protein